MHYSLPSNHLDLLYTLCKKLKKTSFFNPDFSSSTVLIKLVIRSYDSFSYASNRSGIEMGEAEKISLTLASDVASFLP